MRSPLTKARGLGSAKDGVRAWWLERVSAVALVPLSLWLTASLIAFRGRNHAEFITWLSDPLASLLMILLLLALFVHLPEIQTRNVRFAIAGFERPLELRLRRVVVIGLHRE